MAKSSERAVLVTTLHRGVFFGYATKTSGKHVTLKRARNVVYWSSDVKGFLGLAATGPTSSCRIGPAVPSFDARDVTSVTDVTPEAAKAFEAGPWA